jgi:galactokinase
MRSSVTLPERASALLEHHLGLGPDVVAVVPGRVNLMGDHTDYNDGMSLPMAIDRYTAVAMRRRDNGDIRVFSELGSPVTFDPTSMAPGGRGWGEYVAGVVWALGGSRSPWDGAVSSSVPIGAGLSSSASLEVAVAMGMGDLFDDRRSQIDVARAAHRAEVEWVGVSCGLMDQMAVALASAESALLIDFRSLETMVVPFSNDLAIAVLDTATTRELLASPYNTRRAECEEAANALGVASLREIGIDDLGSVADRLDDVQFRRVRHVVTENARVVAAVEALESDDHNRLGDLMTESHLSLRDDYESSSEELDLVVSIAEEYPGCYGARVTGAGWGGCAVAAVDWESADDFASTVAARYRTEADLNGDVYVCRPAVPARVIPSDSEGPHP